MQRLLAGLSLMLLCSCATTHKTYLPPDSAKLQASTHRVAAAVDKAHVAARKAQSGVIEASVLAKRARSELAKVKNVPVSVLDEIVVLEVKLDEIARTQKELENHLAEADAAKAQVEKDKLDYFAAAQTLADKATEERERRIKVEKSLSWYRWHWWLSWAVAGIGVIICIIIAVVKFAAKLRFPLLL